MYFKTGYRIKRESDHYTGNCRQREEYMYRVKPLFIDEGFYNKNKAGEAGIA